jgi:hypothetical protein
MAHVDAHALAATCSLPPHRRGRKRSRADRRLRCRPDRERGRQDRFTAGECDVTQRRIVECGGAPKSGQHIEWIGSGHENPLLREIAAVNAPQR